MRNFKAVTYSAGSFGSCSKLELYIHKWDVKASILWWNVLRGTSAFPSSVAVIGSSSKGCIRGSPARGSERASRMLESASHHHSENRSMNP